MMCFGEFLAISRTGVSKKNNPPSSLANAMVHARKHAFPPSATSRAPRFRFLDYIFATVVMQATHCLETEIIAETIW